MPEPTGPITVEQFTEIVYKNGRSIRAAVVYDWGKIVEEINALIRPLLAEAGRQATMQVRQRIAFAIESLPITTQERQLLKMVFAMAPFFDPEYWEPPKFLSKIIQDFGPTAGEMTHDDS